MRLLSGLRNSCTIGYPRWKCNTFHAMHIQNLSPSRLTICEDNWKIYNKPSSDDSLFWRLVDQIRANGILEPITVDTDFWVISGNRRLTAARHLGLETVPCIISPDVCLADMPPDARLALLAEHNAGQRHKTTEEEICESIALVKDSDVEELLEARKRKTLTYVNTLTTNDVEANQTAVRRDPMKRRREFLAAVQQILKEEEDFLPLSVRAVHYRLCDRTFRMDTARIGSVYKNNMKSYKALSRLLTDARILGLVPFDACVDETRPVTSWEMHTNVGSFIEKEAKRAFAGYWRNLLSTQPAHIEVVVEKMTVAGILRPVCEKFTLSLMAARGYGSIDARHGLHQRFRASGKDKLLVLVMADHDPEGQNIPEQLRGSLVKDFKMKPDSVIVRRVGLNVEHVQRFNLLPALEAKTTSTRFKKFAKKFGTHAYELEAIPSIELQKILEDAITGSIDVDLFNAEVEKERQEQTKLAGLSKHIRSQVAQWVGNGGGE